MTFQIPALTPLHKLGLVGAGLLIVVLILWGYMAALERDAKNLAIAEEKEKVAAELAEANRKRDEEKAAEREQTAKLLEANADLARRLQETVAQSNARAVRDRAAVLAPKSTEQVVKDTITQMGITPKVEADNRLSITREELQAFLALKVDVDRLTRNSEAHESQIRVLEDTNRRLIEQKQGYEESLREKDTVIAKQQEAIAAYAKVAKRGKLRRFGSAVGKVGLTVVPAVAVAVLLRK